MDQEYDLEDVLLVPPRMAQSAYQLLFDCDAAPRPYHLEGRFGSRTHRVDEKTIGLPVTSEARVKAQAEKFPELAELISRSDVSLVRKTFVPSRRAKGPPEIDARQHPELQPSQDAGTSSTEGNSIETIPSVKKVKKEAAFTYAEMFAGIGGFGVALEALGGECVFLSELEEHIRETYRANFSKPTILHGDIYKVKDEDLPEEGLDLLVGGFPCQPFSALGDQPGLQCSKGRGHLFLEIVRVLNKSKPTAFLLENVPGLLKMKDTFELIVKALEESGYVVHTEICAARGLTATGRKRLFFVGLRHDVSTASSFQFPFVPDLKIRAQDVLDYDEIDETEASILELAPTTLSQLLNGGRWRPSHLAWPNLVCETLTSHYGNAVGRGESQLVPRRAPNRPRRFSVRECARLMGFPDSYRFLPRRPKQGEMAHRKENYRMIGNAVCPPVIAVLAGAVLSHCMLPGHGETDWTAQGRMVAIQLSNLATRKEPAPFPMGCKVPET